jgi:sugar (pentulose or hexulose) kinase
VRSRLHVAVIDIGKTTAKLVLVDRRTGTTLESLARPNRVLPGPPYPHADVDGLWSFVIRGLERLEGAHGVDAIAVTTHGATAALVSGNGLALPVLDYEYHGPETLARDYDKVRPDPAETLSPRLPAGLNLGAQLYWQARAFPEAFSAVEAILPYPQYWAWRLTGVAASEVTSLGCHTDLWAPVGGRFSSLAEREGWSRRMPSPLPAMAVLGSLSPSVAGAAKLREVPVVCGIHDSNASLMPWLRRLEPPFTVISSGTWTIVMTVGGGLARLDLARDALANVDAFGRPVPTARFMGGREYATLLGDGPVPAGPEDVARAVAAGALAVPSFAPGVGPYGAGRGRWEGPVDALPARARTAAADLYLALVTQTCLGLVGTGTRIVVEGPLAGNTIYCGLLSGLTGVPVHASTDATGTALGAAMLLDAEGAADGPSLAPAVPPLRPPGTEAYARRWAELAAEAAHGA